MIVGCTCAPDWRDYPDPLTSRQVFQLTDSHAQDFHIYFYNPSIARDGNQVIFTSNRTGSSNIYLTDWNS